MTVGVVSNLVWQEVGLGEIGGYRCVLPQPSMPRCQEAGKEHHF